MVKVVLFFVFFVFVFFFHSACPGKVAITSSESTCHSVTIHWISPLDENHIPYEVRFKYSYKKENRLVTFRKIVTCTSWTIENLPSDLSVNFSLKAMNKRGVKGPSTYFTIKTRKPSEFIIYLHNYQHACVM